MEWPECCPHLKTLLAFSKSKPWVWSKSAQRALQKAQASSDRTKENDLSNMNVEEETMLVERLRG